MKLFHKLISGFLLVAILIWVAGYMAVTLSRQALKETYIGENEAFALNIMTEIDRTIHNRIELFQAYAHDEMLHDGIEESNRAFDSIDDVGAYIDRIEREWASAEEGGQYRLMVDITNNKQSTELKEKTAFFEERYHSRVYGEVLITNKYGANIAQTGAASGYRHDNEEWWQTAKKEGLSIKDVFYDKSLDMYAISAGIGIYDKEENFIGAMKVALNIDEVIHIIENLRNKKNHADHRTMVLRLLTKEGRIIYSNDEKDTFYQDSAYLLPSWHMTAEDRHPAVSREAHRVEHHESRGRDNYDEQNKMIVIHAHSKGYRQYPGLGWILAMGHQEKEVFVSIDILKGRIIIVSILINMLAVFMGFFFSSSIVRSVKKLHHAAQKIGEGDLNTAIEIRSGDEIGDLAAAFQQMTSDLRTARESREKLTEELARSNRELQKFANIASHDLQEPLRKVTGFGSRLKEKYADVLGEKGKDYIERMMNAAARMQSLIDGLLDYSRVTTRAKPFSQTDLSTVAREVLSDLEVRIEQTGAKIELYDLPTIEADPLQMRQLFQNLLGNALKFHKPGEPPVVTVSCTSSGPYGKTGTASYAGVCQICVEDHGIGVDEKYQDRIFEVFQRLHGKSEYEGTGIGLSVCKKIVERHGGDIKVKSCPGEGALFIITLPVSRTGEAGT